MGNGFDSISRLMAAVENPESILKKIGALGAAESQKAFEDQSFGGIEWPKRYPNQQYPTINIAGVLADFAAGKNKPKINRMQARPALVDTSTLKRTLTYRVRYTPSDYGKVRWGSPVDYAQKHQDGGTSTFIITDDMKKRIKSWLYKKDGNLKKGRQLERYNEKDIARKMRPFMSASRDEYTVNIVRRPFVGVTRELGQDIKKMLKMHFEEAQDGRS